jgi:NHL repeat-containing protein
MRLLSALLCVMLSVAAAGARAADVRIEFKVKAATDVAVTIEDGKGRIVRHLAGGVLGDNAPAPLKKGSLSQSLVWDGKDDDGKAVAPGQYRARVGMGLKVASAGTAFTKQAGPATLTGDAMGLAVGPDGRCYVMTRRWHSGHWRASSIHAFNRDGSYANTIKPVSGKLAVGKLAGIGALKDDNGGPRPMVHRVVAMSFYPWEDLNQHMAVAGGKLWAVVVKPAYDKKPVHYLTAIDGKDGAPLAQPLGEPLVGRAGLRDVYLAASSDGKAVYLTGLNAYDAKFESKKQNGPVVYRVALDGARKAVAFFGDRTKPGKDGKHLTDPRGLAVDGKGLLYVADRANNRVLAVREKDGSVAAQMAVPAPRWVGVSRTSGAVYVESGGALLRFASAKDPAPKKLALPALPERYARRSRWFFALDDSQKIPVLWVANTYAGTGLLRCEFKNGKFTELKQAKYLPARRLWNVSVGQDRGTVACKVGWRGLRLLDEKTGKTRDLSLTGSSGQTYRLGPNDQIYGIDHWKWGIRRWDKNGKSMPFPATMNLPTGGARGRLTSKPSGTTSWERDFGVDRKGNIYVKSRGKHYHGRMTVNEYDKDGNLKRIVLWAVSDGAMGPRIDLKGNLYIAEAVKPVGQRHPEWARDKFPSILSSKQYTWMYGSIIKFGPKGGSMWFPVRTKVDEYAFDGKAKLDPSLKKEKVSTIHSGRLYFRPGELQGALWWKFGCSPVLDMHRSHNIRCHCTGSDFDVDDFGRVFYPDQGRFCVVVRDTNGNKITEFGRYGNQDDAGPEITFGWILGLGVSDKYVYVPDALNRRVQRCKMTYAKEEVIPISLK